MLQLCNYSCHSYIPPHPHFVFTLSFSPLIVTNRAEEEKNPSESHFPVCLAEGQAGKEPASLVIGVHVCVRVFIGNWKRFSPLLAQGLAMEDGD